MKILKLILLVLISGLFIVKASGQENARHIMQKSKENGKFKGLETVSTLKIIDKKGRERIRRTYMASKSYDNENLDKRIIIFLSPSDVKGTGMLVYDYDHKADDMWIYLPALRKTRRIVSSEKGKSFMGSEFSNADMSAINPDDFTFKILGREKVNETDCWKIECIPSNDEIASDLGYSKEILFVAKKDYILRKAIYFDLDEEVLKTLTSQKVKMIDTAEKKFFATELIMENHQNGRKSEIIMEEIEVNKDLPDDIFTTAYMERQ